MISYAEQIKNQQLQSFFETFRDEEEDLGDYDLAQYDEEVDV